MEQAARVEQVRRIFERHVEAAWKKHQQQLFDWQVQRVVTTSELLGVPVEEVHQGHIVWCHSLHGVPPLEDEAPRFADIPMDGRLRRAVDRL